MPSPALTYLSHLLPLHRTTSITTLPIPPPRSPSPPPLPPPRLLLLGLSSTGKTTFLTTLRRFTSAPTANSTPLEPTTVTIDELPLAPSQSAVVSDIAAVDARRVLRLHFPLSSYTSLSPPPSKQKQSIGLLWFIDLTDRSRREEAVVELSYSVGLVKARAGGRVRFVGVVCKDVPAAAEDAAEEEDETQQALDWVHGAVAEVLEPILGAETPWMVIPARRGARRWSVGREESVRVVVEMLVMQMGGIRFLRSAGMGGSLRMPEREARGGWRSVREVRKRGE
ncbi:hypothetical protein EX30DRAFT_381155 [Ascodesmis nigricans]|uniref:Uncharacterized protein n=1 Tax=Ascodesmis nigricans TaxID=341454 RepID=A0A4V3SJF5_9PEZI|nr:hypothetical protein EX30DRAFT_381155 [Ascodesmis nigricans]